MSIEMATAIVIFLGACVLKFTAPFVFKNLYLILTSCFNHMIWYRATPENLQWYTTGILLQLSKMLIPLMFLFLLVGALATLVQTGWVVSWKKGRWDLSKLVKWNWNQVNPFQGKKVAELLINVGKIGLLTLVLYYSLRGSVKDWIPLLDAPVIRVWFFMFHFAFEVVMKISVIMFVLATLDFIYRRKKYLDDLKMTKHEVKDERKKSEGDPKIKSALRSKRFAFFRQLMMESVPKADVVITNPTRIAVALKYDAETMEAPRVLAKGIGKLAERIRSIARDHDIPVVENKPLAQVLFKTVEVGGLIPVSLYKTVAEILAYVFRLKNKKAA
jgi:flagellar biosynthetic protein FlhB